MRCHLFPLVLPAILLHFLLIQPTSASAQASGDVEIGIVAWERDYEGALKASEKKESDLFLNT